MKVFWIAGTVLSVAFCCLMYMAADRLPPYEYIVEKSYVRPDPTHPGRSAIIHWEFKVNRLCPGAIVRTIVDANTGAKISYDPTPALGTVQKSDTSLERAFLLPDGILPGRKIYRANAEYICNPLQRLLPLKVQTPDIYFDVVALPETFSGSGR